jgi:branched-chain amino acid transport system substrate-binding protein
MAMKELAIDLVAAGHRTLGGILGLCGLVFLASCGDAGPARVGVILPITGAGAVDGEAVRRGIELAYEERYRGEPAEASGPLPELVIVDSESDPARWWSLLGELAGDGVSAVIGGPVVPTGDSFAEPGSIVLDPLGGGGDPVVSRNVFRLGPSAVEEARAAGYCASQLLDADRAMVISPESERAPQEIFAETFEAYGGEVWEVIEYPSTIQDFGGLAQRAVTVNPDLVYVTDRSVGGPAMVRALRSEGFSGILLATSALAHPPFLELLGDDAEGVFLTRPAVGADRDDARGRAFVEGFQQRYGEPPGFFNAVGYDAFNVLAEVLAQGARSPDEVRTALRSLRSFPGVTGELQLDDGGAVHREYRLQQLHGRKGSDYPPEAAPEPAAGGSVERNQRSKSSAPMP